MKKDLIGEILKIKPISKEGLQVTLTRIKSRKNLKTVQQAACYYILSQKLKINVSSVMDDVTRAVINNEQPPRSVLINLSRNSISKGKGSKPSLPRVKWVAEHYYSLANRLSDFYGYLFLYENALRQRVDLDMEKTYPNWWETKIKNELRETHKYAEDRKVEAAKFPMISQAQNLKPYEYITLGHLEEIVIKYQSVFVPSVFPYLHFFTGHMVIVKRVRNAVAHNSPALSLRDIQNAKHEIDILLQHFSAVA